ncbi:MAG: hypothetical protein VKK63_00290 [Synechococcus sp.]|nr:hypothetical protein [Synechococcus sp.]
MTRKHYIELASAMRHALKSNNNPEQRAAIREAYVAIIDTLDTMNGNFNRSKFIEAVHGKDS